MLFLVACLRPTQGSDYNSNPTSTNMHVSDYQFPFIMAKNKSCIICHLFLVHYLLHRAGFPTWTGGAFNMHFVLFVNYFQLMTVQEFKPAVCTVLRQPAPKGVCPSLHNKDTLSEEKAQGAYFYPVRQTQVKKLELLSIPMSKLHGTGKDLE